MGESKLVYLMGIDVGTTGAKALLINEAGEDEESIARAVRPLVAAARNH
jgi:sugar (pentulose or hexulose) kinase